MHFFPHVVAPLSPPSCPSLCWAETTSASSISLLLQAKLWLWREPGNPTASLTSHNELLTSHFFAPYCEFVFFFPIYKHAARLSSEPFGCWYKIHNGCQNLQFFLLFYEVRQYYLHWCIPFPQLKTFSFEHDRLRESWFCNLPCETQREGAGA